MTSAAKNQSTGSNLTEVTSLTDFIAIEKEKRKSRVQLFGFIFLLVLLFIGFCVFCLTHNYASFLVTFLGILSHITVLVIGYYFGNTTK